jgi:ABC-type amino acid transport substrate-binding protein
MIQRLTALLGVTIGLLSIIASSAPALADGRLERIRQSGVLRVCIWPDYYGITYRSPRDGVLRGVDVDLSRAFAGDLGVKLEYVDTNFAQFIRFLEEDRCDIAMMAVSITQERLRRVEFSRPYLRSSIVIVAPKASQVVRSWEDINRPGVVLAVMAGTVMEDYFRATLTSGRLSVLRPPETREEEVLSGRADAFATDYAYSRRVALEYDWANVLEPRLPVGVSNYGYAVAKGQPGWLARVDQFVAAIKGDNRLRDSTAAHGLTAMSLHEKD